MAEFDIESHTIYKVRHGSHAYGCNIEGSDEDFKGIAIAPMDFYLSPFKKFEQSEKMANNGHPNDEVIYDIKKILSLAASCNPNIIEVFFVDESDIVKNTRHGRRLLDVRDIFITKQCFHSFSGYAYSQFKRIKTHRSWLLNPPSKKPEREDFGLSRVAKVTSSEMGAYDAILEVGEILPDSIMEVLNKEKKYASAKREWDQYQNWKNTRNKKRAELEAKFSFDVKHAYHLVRLSRMAWEILEGRGVMVRRPDKDELIAIRSGAWTYERLELWFEKQQQLNKIAFENSKLPEAVDFNLIDELCFNLILDFNRWNC